MGWKNLVLFLSLLLMPPIVKAQEPEEWGEDKFGNRLYPDFSDSVNTMYWNEYDFIDFGGGPWKIFDNGDKDIAIRFGKPTLYDTIADTIYFTVHKVYLQPIYFSALKDTVTLDAFRDFALSDGSKTLGINWLGDYGRALYKKYNPKKLRQNPKDGCPSDILVVGPAKEKSRILPFIVAQTTVQGTKKAHFAPFLKGPIYFKYCNTSFERDNFDWYDNWYDIKVDE